MSVTIPLYYRHVLGPLVLPLVIHGNLLTIHSTGISVRELLDRASEQSGQKYRATTALAPDVVAIQIEGVDPDVFESKLAHVLGARWTTQGDVKRLELDPQVEIAEAKERRAAWLRGIERVRSSFSKRLTKLPAFDAETAKSMLRRVDERVAKEAQNSEFGLADALNREGNLPVNRLLGRLITSLPAESLLNLTPNSRLVYAQQPNSRQRPLPSAANSAIQSFLKEEATWEKAQNVYRANSPKTSEIPTLPTSGKFVLSIACDENGDGGSISVAIVGPDGKNHLSETVGVEDWDEAAANAWQIPPKPVPGESPVVESETTRLIRQLCQKWPDTRPTEQKPDPNIQKILRDPLSYEPLGFVPGELWSNTAIDRKRNLIAYVTDSDFGFVPDPAEGARTPSTVLQRVAHHHQVEEEDSWLLVSPKNFAMARLNRLDRKLNQTLLIQAIEQGGYTIEDAASFKAYHPNGYPFYEWPNGYLYAFLPRIATTSGIDLAIQSNELRLYGSLTPYQQAELRRRPINLSSLPKLRSLLEELVYVDEWGSRHGRYEVTELYARGLPDTMMLSLVSDQTTESVQPISSDPDEFTFYIPAYTAERLGQSLARVESQNWTQFLRVRTRTLELKLTFANGFTQPIQLSELRQLDTAPVPFGQLSSAFRQAAEAARQEALRNPKSNAPPPPAEFAAP